MLTDFDFADNKIEYFSIQIESDWISNWMNSISSVLVVFLTSHPSFHFCLPLPRCRKKKIHSHWVCRMLSYWRHDQNANHAIFSVELEHTQFSTSIEGILDIITICAPQVTTNVAVNQFDILINFSSSRVTSEGGDLDSIELKLLLTVLIRSEWCWWRSEFWSRSIFSMKLTFNFLMLRDER